MTMFVLKLCLFFCILSLAAAKLEDNEEAILRSFENCKKSNGDPIDLPDKLEDLQNNVDPDTNAFYIQGKLNITKPLRHGTQVNLTLSKCLTQEDPNSCNKYYQTIYGNHFCQHVDDTAAKVPWADIMDHANGLIPECPIEVGVYDVSKTRVDVDKLVRNIAIKGWWRLYLFFKSKDDEPLMCFEYNVEVKKKRRKKTG